MATPRKKMASEGPKRSVAKPTAAQSAAAKKKAAVKKSAAEGPKRSRVKPSATAMAIAKSKPKVVEAGVGNIPMTVARAAVAVGKKIKSQTPKTKATAAAEKQKQQKIWQQAENEMKATKAKVEKELAAIAKKRAAVEKKGAEAPKRRGTAVPNPKYATEYSRKQTSVRYQDHNGNWGWR